MTDLIFGVIGTLLYPLFSIVFVVIDILQNLFLQLAGIGDIWVADPNGLGNIPITSTNGGSATDTGLIFYLLNTPLVKNMFLSILVLAVFLMIVFAVMAFLKNAYSAKPKTWQEIVGSALKGIINFVFVPVCCLLGVWLGNIVLKAINGATSSSGATLMSRKLFLCCAYDANVYRNGLASGSDGLYNLTAAYDLALYGDLPFEKSDITESLTQQERADMLDQIYASGAISVYDQVSVSTGYSLWQINYLTLIVGGVFMAYVLISLAYAMIRRMFILIMLFIISPAMCAMYPLDDGKALGSWRGDFVKQTLSAYGAVAGMNLFFSILPIVDTIYFTGLGNAGVNFVSSLIQLLMMVCGLFVVKEFIAMISGYIGAEDSYQKGTTLRSSTKEAVKKHGTKAISGAFKYGTRAIHASRDATRGGRIGKIAAFNHSLFKSGANDLSKGLFGVDWTNGKDGWDALKNSELFKPVKDGIKAANDEHKENKKIKEGSAKISEAKGKFEDKLTAHDTAKEEYEALKASKPEDLGMSKEEYKHKLAVLRGKIGGATRAKNAAEKGYASTVSSVGAELTEYQYKEVAKEAGIDVEEFKKYMGISTETENLLSQQQEAHMDANAMVYALDMAASRNPDKKKKANEILGFDIEKLANVMSKPIDELIKLFKGGVKLDLKDKDSAGNKIFDKAEDAALATAYNRAIDKQQDREDQLSDANKALVDYLKTNLGEIKIVGQDGGFVIDDKSIKDLEEALKNGDGAEDNPIIKALSQYGDKYQKKLIETLDNVSKLTKAIKDVNKDKK